MIFKMAKSVDFDEKEELFKIIASEAVMDRDREIMLPSGWELDIYKSHPVILDRHLNENMRTIGKAVDVENTGEQLILSVKYWNNEGNPYADWCYFIAKKRMAAFSVGYTPKEWSEDVFSKEFKAAKEIGLYKDERPIRIYTRQVLDEVSQVAIPSLQTALQKNASLDFDETMRHGEKAFPEEADYIKWKKSERKSYVVPLIERIDRLEKEQEKLYKAFYPGEESQKVKKPDIEDSDVVNDDVKSKKSCDDVYAKIRRILKG